MDAGYRTKTFGTTPDPPNPNIKNKIINYKVNQIKSFQSLDFRELRTIDANSRLASHFSLVAG